MAFIRKWFRKKALLIAEPTTVPLSGEQLEDRGQAIQPLEPLQLIVGSGRSIGRQRDHNEDSLYTFTSTFAGYTTSVPFGIYIIADGMGGHEHGEVASEAAIRAMSKYLMKKLYLPLINTLPEVSQESLQEIMKQGVFEAHNEVVKQAPGGGTTLTAVIILGNRMAVAHVGDSRAYAVYPDGRMEALTRDHSFVKRLEELGQITPDEAEVHPQRNVLYRALGQGEPFEPDVSTVPMPRSGYVLVCSDGLWGIVPDAEMFDLISAAASPHLACQNLIQAANAAGGPDNITAILIQMPA